MPSQSNLNLISKTGFYFLAGLIFLFSNNPLLFHYLLVEELHMVSLFLSCNVSNQIIKGDHLANDQEFSGLTQAGTN